MDYFSHPFDFTKYLSCGLDRFAFVKSCAPGTYWDNNVKTCVAEEIIVTIPKSAPKSIFDGPMRSYAQTLPQAPLPLPATTPAYKQYETVTMAPPMQTPPPMTTPAYKQYETVTLPRQTPPPFIPPTTPRSPYSQMTRPQLPFKPQMQMPSVRGY